MSSNSRLNCPKCNSIQTKYNSSLSNSYRDVYSCKNCGYKFAIEFDSPSEAKPKKQGCFGFFIKTLVLSTIAFVALIVYLQKDGKEVSKINHKEESISKKNTSDESIRDSQNMNDTLSIKTTTRSN